MGIGTFEEILSKIQYGLKRENTPYREAINAKGKGGCMFEIRC